MIHADLPARQQPIPHGADGFIQNDVIDARKPADEGENQGRKLQQEGTHMNHIRLEPGKNLAQLEIRPGIHRLDESSETRFRAEADIVGLLRTGSESDAA